jgi:uncharacterized protein YjlB
MVDVRRFMLPPNEWVPNNPHMPVRLYRNAFEPGVDVTAAAFEELFRRHGWDVHRLGIVHADHQYHSMAHEVLGIAGGNAILMIGGPGGKKISLDAGDALLLPAGTGHCEIAASRNFLAVGAHPDGQRWDVCGAAPSADMIRRIASLELPHRDPVLG